ncbi:MAG: hypothetical protein LUQ01_06285 [Methanolinea sp.]|nr:hypothetical protein [Methanolinea sp.]
MQKAIFLILLLFAVILAAACTEIPPPAPATSIPTSTTPQPTPSFSLVPEPTDVIPAVYSVSIQVTKNTISTDPSITVSFRGGQGLGFVETMQAVVILSDGKEGSGSVDNPRIGSEIILPGTTKTDRVMVYVTIDNGVRYKVIDQDMPFQPINPTF